MTNSANGCRKGMLIFCIIKCLLSLASHNANQFIPLLFHRKRMHITIFLLLSCMLYLRCSVRNLLTGRSKSVKKII